MTRIFGLLLVGAIAFSAIESTRAADGQISDAQLASLGLGGMQKMSDAQGMQVRGKFVFSQYALTQLYLNTYTNLQGPLGPTQAANIANIQLGALVNVNTIMATKFPPPGGLGGIYGTVGAPGYPFNVPFIINTIPGLPPL